MNTVEDESGRRFLLVKRSADSWLVRDPSTGAESYRDAAELTIVEDASALETASEGIDPAVRRLLTAVHSERILGLVVTIVDRDAVAVRELLDTTTLCESDLHGAIAELVAAGLLAETTVAGERGYEATELAASAVEQLRSEE
ncbi:hypothetical protein L593_02215 [Salinarchaeum sp. Harcht-Bsk1]|uniref:DUF7346 family protein n=1 Tax=Salinarchaeum sp. Harcht-Bsk1 TaxID=1333523 RepID=UPI0003424796|nr:hypothetical protein [Salinarchaeum sp. Harcht-Bsk1]AGN00394.1 hypothetical protein L593_02215 [Salinarchaeum sp. Harcht-Bsk1]